MRVPCHAEAREQQERSSGAAREQHGRAAQGGIPWVQVPNDKGPSHGTPYKDFCLSPQDHAPPDHSPPADQQLKIMRARRARAWSGGTGKHGSPVPVRVPHVGRRMTLTMASGALGFAVVWLAFFVFEPRWRRFHARALLALPWLEPNSSLPLYSSSSRPLTPQSRKVLLTTGASRTQSTPQPPGTLGLPPREILLTLLSLPQSLLHSIRNLDPRSMSAQGGAAGARAARSLASKGGGTGRVHRQGQVVQVAAAAQGTPTGAIGGGFLSNAGLGGGVPTLLQGGSSDPLHPRVQQAAALEVPGTAVEGLNGIQGGEEVPEQRVRPRLQRAPTEGLPGWDQKAPQLPGLKQGVRHRVLSLKEAVDIVGGPERSIILATCTANFLDFLHNFLLSVAAIGYTDRVLVIAEDEDAFAFLHARMPNQTVKGWEISKSEIRGNASDQGAGLHNAYFNSVLLRRPKYLLALLNLNTTILSSDIDNVWLKDPYPQFKGDYDLWLMHDLSWYARYTWDTSPAIRDPNQNYCTCFIYIIPNERTKGLLTELIASMERHNRENPGGVFEQTEWNEVMSLTAAGLAVRVGVLSPYLFPTGCVYFGCRPHVREAYAMQLGDTQWREVAVVIQNNWLSSHKAKVERFKEHGMWFVTHSTAALQ